MNIPICCICFDRINSLKRLLKSLENADYDGFNPTLIISIDKSNTSEVESFAKSYSWPYGKKIVYTHQENLGLRKHVLECGNRIIDYDGMIVLEDDIIVSPGFYQFAQNTLSFYQKDKNIAGISLYSFRINYQTLTPFIPIKGNSDVYFMKCAQSWGQVWIKERWIEFYQWYINNDEEFKDNGILPKSICSWPKSSWLKYHTRYCIEKNKYFVYPYTSLSSNNSDAGTHVDKKNATFQVPLQLGSKKTYSLQELNDPYSIRYDGFFESENIIESLKEYKNICINFYGQKNILNYRYVLSIASLPFKVERSWALSLRPVELNVILNQDGKGVFLYDTDSCAKSPEIDVIYNQNFIWNIPSIIHTAKSIGLRNILKSYINNHFVK